MVLEQGVEDGAPPGVESLALDVTLDADTVAALDGIWPGPGTASTSYAW